MRSLLAISVVFFFCHSISAQTLSDSLRLQGKAARIVTYNVENLFDVVDDPDKEDNEFLPLSVKRWDEAKYWRKQGNTAKAILAVGGVQPADIIGLCEIENKLVLQDLTQNSPLKNAGYLYIHQESADKRGVDVALLYRPETFQVVSWKAIPVRLPPDGQATRDILYVKGVLLQTDTIHVFVNHWPSRIGGVPKTEPLRNHVAKLLKEKSDSISRKNKQALIFILGDFNDDPTNMSIANMLQAGYSADDNMKSLINLCYPMYKRSEGSLVHRDKIDMRWCMFDQIIVSASIFWTVSKFKLAEKEATVFKAPFLLETDADGEPAKPIRTYQGPIYKGGFSDHLPVYTDVLIR